MTSAPDLIVSNARVSTLTANPTTKPVAITDSKFSAVGHDRDVMKLAGKLVGRPLSDRGPPRLARRWRA
jgi:predicted amidohydrolase YtcJ